MTPAEMNEAAAKACFSYAVEGEYVVIRFRPTGDLQTKFRLETWMTGPEDAFHYWWANAFQPCTNRNALPILVSVVKAHDIASWKFHKVLCRVAQIDEYEPNLLDVLALDADIVTIACLEALEEAEKTT